MAFELEDFTRTDTTNVTAELDSFYIVQER